jgi:hypothetical protein
MNPFVHPELIRVRHAELLRAADHHRLVAAARRTGRVRPRPDLAHLLTRIARVARRWRPGVVAAGPR